MSLVKDIGYRTLDAVTLGRGIRRSIGGEAVRFPAKWSRYYPADYEPETFRFFREHLKGGETVLDIGAHIGLFSVVASRLVGPRGKVFSFEPTPFTRGVLERVIDVNGCGGNVEIRPEAVSSKCGEAIFFDTGNELSNANSLVRSDLSRGELPITLVSIDHFARERGLKIDCMKIDVEGAELDVLLGAPETFAHQRPVARLGLHPVFVGQNGQTLDDIWRVVADHGYAVTFNGEQVEREWFVDQTDLFDVNLIP